MAEPYLEQLTQIISRLRRTETVDATLETRHFFSGAALYANGNICALFSPTGLALKLPEAKRKALIDEAAGSEFHFFAGGPIKKQYVALSESITSDEKALQALISASVRYVTT